MQLISVIVPIYNTEKYLPKCLDSILAQTHTNWEAILVNDGSTDDSGEICDEYARNDRRITVVHQENAGVSSARNRGIEMAKGEWLTFIDADDYIENVYLEILTKQIDRENNVLIIQGLKQINSKREEIKKIEFPTLTLQNNEIEKAFSRMSIYENGYSVAKLYNRDVVNKYNIKFKKDISYSEDMIFMLEYILHCNNIKFIEGAYYNYVIDESVLSRRYNSFESEYSLFQSYINLINNISAKFSFITPENALNNGGQLLMRCLYTMYINKYDTRTRIRNIYKIREMHKNFICDFYKPRLRLFKIIKMAFLMHPLAFDFVCKIKF